MKCTRCGERVSQDMQDQVADNFDLDYEHPTCWNCAVEMFDEGDNPIVIASIPGPDELKYFYARGKS